MMVNYLSCFLFCFCVTYAGAAAAQQERSLPQWLWNPCSGNEKEQLHLPAAIDWLDNAQVQAAVDLFSWVFNLAKMSRWIRLSGCGPAEAWTVSVALKYETETSASPVLPVALSSRSGTLCLLCLFGKFFYKTKMWYVLTMYIQIASKWHRVSSTASANTYSILHLVYLYFLV